MQILGVCGSLQKQSSNLRMLIAMRQRVPEPVELMIFDGIGRLPLFNPDLLSQTPLPDSVTRWKAALTASDALLIACPEYGHSLPGTLKNAIDWVIGSGEFYHKPVAITAAVRHPERGLNGLAALHQTLMAVDADIIWADTVLHDAHLDQQLDTILQAIVRRLQKG
ncbi:MAG: NADPH-dependent FMN reductase [Candidatus Promineifilaceae bacterium]